jgi:hypothetical protein
VLRALTSFGSALAGLAGRSVRGGKGTFSLQALRAFAARFGLGLGTEAGANLETTQVVELISERSLPVALRPAFIRLDRTEPGYRAGAEFQIPVVVPFDSESWEDRLALSSWIDRELPKVVSHRREPSDAEDAKRPQ